MENTNNGSSAQGGNAFSSGSSFAQGDGITTPDGRPLHQAWDINAWRYTLHPDKQEPFFNFG